LGGLAGKYYLIKNLFRLFQDENFYTFIKKYTSLDNVFNWATPGQCTNRCLQLLGILIMMHRNCFKHIIVS